MKQFLRIISLLFVVVVFNSLNAANKEIKIGATARPHAEILEFVKPELAKKGIDLKVIIFQDYILPNRALASKDLDANYFQHVQYLNEQIKTYGYKFVNIGDIHIEPMGIYSKKYKNITEVQEGSSIIISNSVSDRARTLMLLEKAGLLTFKSGVDKTKADFKDIATQKVKFKPEVDPALLSRLYTANEADLIVINTNYAIEAGINPLKDALVIEDNSSPYVNVLVAREDNAKDPALLELAKVLKSAKTKKFIIDKYKGAVVPAK